MGDTDGVGWPIVGECDFFRGAANHEVRRGDGGRMRGRDQQRRFEQLLNEHRRIVFKVAAVYAREAEDRNDLAQEICVQLWRSFASFDETRGRFSTWMYRVALNVAISQVRRVAAGDDHFEPLQQHHLESIGHDAADDPDERLGVLQELISQLDPFNRALILLYLEDRSYEEIAEVLGLSVTNVATKISRIKQKLRGQVSVADPVREENKHGT
jgi:RNA polymerase sigma factor (sigma-70 family)